VTTVVKLRYQDSRVCSKACQIGPAWRLSGLAYAASAAILLPFFGNPWRCYSTKEITISFRVFNRWPDFI